MAKAELLVSVFSVLLLASTFSETFGDAQPIRASLIRKTHQKQSSLEEDKAESTELKPGDGEFIINMGIGNPVQKFSAILDTGSDLSWIQCKPCAGKCIKQEDRLFDPALSSSYANISCHSKICTGTCSNENNCIYYTRYGDASHSAGYVASENFTFGNDISHTVGNNSQPTANHSVIFEHLVFGCGQDQSGSFSDSAGIIGMGRGPLSVVSQLGSGINKTFAYCLSEWDKPEEKSEFFLGNVDGFSGLKFQRTPLLHSQKHSSFYFLSLEGISVNGQAVNIPEGAFKILNDGRGGLIIDSGTTMTHLVDVAYRPFLQAVKASVKEDPLDASHDFDLCYSVNKRHLQLPKVSFHFAGNVTLDLPEENVFVNLGEGVKITCLAFANAGPVGSLSAMGNIQQQNFFVCYDLQNDVLGFASTKCSSL